MYFLKRCKKWNAASEVPAKTICIGKSEEKREGERENQTESEFGNFALANKNANVWQTSNFLFPFSHSFTLHAPFLLAPNRSNCSILNANSMV